MQMKTIIRQTLDTGAAGLGVLRACERRMVGSVTILMYHRVLPDVNALAYPLPPLAMPKSMFEQQVRWLSKRCRVLSVQEAMHTMSRDETHEEPVVCISFDDGYADNAEIAAPVLESHGIRGTFFITAEPVLERSLLWHDRAIIAWQRHGSAVGEVAERTLNLDRSECGARNAGEWANWLKRRAPLQRSEVIEACLDGGATAAEAEPFRMLTAEQVRALHAAGHEISSHTMTHALLPQLDDAHLEAELTGSHKEIADIIGQPPPGICYPNGDVDDRVVQAARIAGYEYGCTTVSGRNTSQTNPMRLKRVDMNPQRMINANDRFSMTAFRGEVCLLHERLRSWKGPTQR